MKVELKKADPINEHLQLLQSLIDAAVKSGLFQTAADVTKVQASLVELERFCLHAAN